MSARDEARNEEVLAAQEIERLYWSVRRRDLGPRTRHDGTGWLRVDFTYEQGDPPVAMEITSITPPIGGSFGLGAG